MSKKSKDDISRELDIALENRSFEIQLFWQRSNYFLVLMTALGIGVFSIDDNVFSLLIAIFATLTSFYWYQTNLGSKFWQESWEVEVVKLAKHMRVRSFERATEDIVKQVEASLGSARLDRDSDGYLQRLQNKIRRFIDRQTIKKPSVSHYMIVLSLTSMLLWAVVSAIFGTRLVYDHQPAADATHSAPSLRGQESRDAKGRIDQDAQTPSAINPTQSSPQRSAVENKAQEGANSNDE